MATTKKTKAKKPVTKSKQSVTKSKQSVTKSKQSVTKSKQSVTKSKQSVTKSKQSVTKSKQPAVADVVAAAELARRGDLKSLSGFADCESESDNDRLAYKWLNAALDFGHKKAAGFLEDLLETSSLRYDDDQYETASAHWELACSYLEGRDGLPVNLKHARTHLEQAFWFHDLDGINDGTVGNYDARPLLKRLEGKAKALLTELLESAPLNTAAE